MRNVRSVLRYESNPDGVGSAGDFRAGTPYRCLRLRPRAHVTPGSHGTVGADNARWADSRAACHRANGSANPAVANSYGPAIARSGANGSSHGARSDAGAHS